MIRKLVGAAAALALVAAATSAEAQRRPEDVFGGQILLSDRAFPTQARSQAAYVQALRKQAKDRFQEDKENQVWRIHYAAFFKRPLNDLEVTVKFFDVTNNSHRLIETYEQYLDSRGQRAITGNMRLKRGDGAYDPNTRILMTMESRGRIIAQARFYILGEQKRYSGKVVFTEEDTRGPDRDDDEDARARQRAEENKRKKK